MRRYQGLSDEQRGLVMMALLAHAIVTIIAKAALALTGIWSVRQCWGARRLGMTSVLRAALGPAFVVAAAANIALWVARRRVLRAVESGRGRIWLERTEQWLSYRVARSNSSSARPSDP
jgi:uncharacterized protein YqgC (DUF456 family)